MPPNTLSLCKVIQSLKQTETVILPSQNNAQSWWEMANGASCSNLPPSTSPRAPAFAVPVHPWVFWRGWWQWRGTRVVLRQSRSYPEIKPTDQHKDTNCSTAWKSDKWRQAGPQRWGERQIMKGVWNVNPEWHFSTFPKTFNDHKPFFFLSPYFPSITIPLFSSLTVTHSSGWNNTVILSNCEDQAIITKTNL